MLNLFPIENLHTYFLLPALKIDSSIGDHRVDSIDRVALTIGEIDTTFIAELIYFLQPTECVLCLTI